MLIYDKNKRSNIKLGINLIFLIYINLFSSFCQQKNNFCKGNFQAYTLSDWALSVSGSLIYYTHISNDTQCWYSKTEPDHTVQIKTFKLNNIKSKVLDFNMKQKPYIPCQILTLQPNSKYQLQFDFLLDLFHQSASVSVLINNIIIFQTTSYNNSIALHSTINFITNTSINQICFNNTNVTRNSYDNAILLVSGNNFGPLLDNVNINFMYNLNNSTINGTNYINSSYLNNINQTSNSNTSYIDYTSININNSTNIQINENTQKIKYVINFETQWNPYKGILLFLSTFKSTQNGITLDAFKYCKVQINNQLIENPLFKQDINGYLYVQTIPQIVYSTQILSSIKIYIDPQFLMLMNNIYVFTINGNQINIDVQYYQSQKIITKLEPFVQKLSQIIRQAFTIMNLLNCSYFIMNLIQFWNLTLLYNFLMIKSLPKFSQAILSRMINFYFTYNSFSIQINKMVKHSQKNQNLFDFSNLSQLQKMSYIKDDHVWFGFLGGSSNFMMNNIDSLIMIVFFIVKIFLLQFIQKIIIFIFPKLSSFKFNISFKNFPNQVLCFSPFFLVSSVQVFLFLGQTKIQGKLNNIFHISSIFIIISLSFFKLIQFQKTNKRINAQKKSTKTLEVSTTQSFKKRSKSKYEQLIQILLNLLIPTLVVIRNQITFFIIISMTIILKLIIFFKYQLKYSFMQKVLRIFSNINWLLYHLSFLSFFIIDQLSLKNISTSKTLIKTLGFIVISCILLGGLFDILQFIVKIVINLFKGLKYIYKRCLSSNKSKKSKNIFKNYQKNKEFSRQIISKSCKIKQKLFKQQNKPKIIHQKNNNNQIKSYNNSQLFIPVQQVIRPSKTIKPIKKSLKKAQEFQKSKTKQILIKQNRITFGERQ